MNRAWPEDPSVVVVDRAALSGNRGQLLGLDPAVEIVVVTDGDLDVNDLEAMVGRLRRETHLDAVGTVSPVTDAMKRIDVAERVLATLDRGSLRHLELPVAVRRDRLDVADQAFGIDRLGVV